MGFSTLVVQVMFFSFMLLVLVGVFVITKQNLLDDRKSLDAKRDLAVDRISTQINIENVTYGLGKTTIWVRNEGSTVLNPAYLEIYLDQTRVERNDSGRTTRVLAPDLYNPGLWDPDELLEINYTLGLATNNHSVKIVTEYTISDTKIFEVT